MTKAGLQDKAAVVALLTEAFHDNKSVNYIIQQDDRKLLRIQHLMEYAFACCYRYGTVWLSSDRNACALLLYPDQKGNTWLLDLQLVLRSVGWRNVGKVLRREAFVKSHHPKDTFAYLLFIGVVPRMQGKGMGRALMCHILAHYRQQQRPIYLETSNKRNRAFYQQQGFTLYHQSDQFGYPLFFFKSM